MGREIRKVPPHYVHPTDRHGKVPMRQQTYTEALAEWQADYDRFQRGELTEYERKYCSTEVAWLADNPKPKDGPYYRTWSDEEATWIQVWETVSGGTPVSPPFATPNELVEYLIQGGDEWDRKHGRRGYTRHQAEAFVRDGWVPSAVIQGGVMYQGIESADIIRK